LINILVRPLKVLL